MSRICAYLSLLATWAYGPTLWSQVSVTLSPQAGDSLYHLVDNLPSSVRLGYPGAEKVWDFTGLQSPFVRTNRYREDSQGRLIITRNGCTRQYHLHEDGLLLSAILDADPLKIGVPVNLYTEKPLTEYAIPIEYQDDQSEFSRFEGLLPIEDLPSEWRSAELEAGDLLQIVLEVSRDQVVDSYGSLLMQNEGFDVMRMYRTELRQLRVYALKGGEESDAIDLTSHFQSKLQEVDWEVNSYQYHFLANDLPGPVAIVHVNEYDEAWQVEYSTDPKLARPIQPDARLRGVYVYPNPSFGMVRFEFFQIPPGLYQIKIHNVLGKELWSVEEQLEEGKVVESDLSFLRRGTYFYSLEDGSGKRIVTRRLAIIKP